MGQGLDDLNLAFDGERPHCLAKMPSLAKMSSIEYFYLQISRNLQVLSHDNHPARQFSCRRDLQSLGASGEG
jgi:hypothetical protein